MADAECVVDIDAVRGLAVDRDLGRDDDEDGRGEFGGINEAINDDDVPVSKVCDDGLLVRICFESEDDGGR